MDPNRIEVEVRLVFNELQIYGDKLKNFKIIIIFTNSGQ
jgi:hypothetical protein